MICEMLSTDLIYSSNSPYSSLVIMIKKNDGDFALTIVPSM